MTTLQQKLDQLKAAFVKKAPDSALTVMSRATQDLRESGIGDRRPTSPAGSAAATVRSARFRGSVRALRRPAGTRPAGRQRLPWCVVTVLQRRAGRSVKTPGSVPRARRSGCRPLASGCREECSDPQTSPARVSHPRRPGQRLGPKAVPDLQAAGGFAGRLPRPRHRSAGVQRRRLLAAAVARTDRRGHPRHHPGARRGPRLHPTSGTRSHPRSPSNPVTTDHSTSSEQGKENVRDQD